MVVVDVQELMVVLVEVVEAQTLEQGAQVILLQLVHLKEKMVVVVLQVVVLIKKQQVVVEEQ
tara:strand:+ start:207 stop:392 length:186 start_codon:yes stop_codon:yes gene_type:complete